MPRTKPNPSSQGRRGARDTAARARMEAIRREAEALGQLFTEWGVKLTDKQVGSLTSTDTKSLTVHVNGEKVAEDPAMLVLQDEQQIALVYGEGGQDADVPDTYDFSGV